ncbi:MAG: PDGLE domain-containing protein [Dehalococcoidia bacterium]|nr:PDGLE domain-containing protein [Dehalococcoidia bacterium]
MKSKWWIIGLSIALLLAIISPIASQFPDGLDRFAEDNNFGDQANEPAFTVIPDYSFPGVSNDATATIIAGVLGTLILFGFAFGLASLLKSKNEA